MTNIDNIIRMLAEHKGEFALEKDNIRHSWAKCTVYNRNCCPLAFLAQKEGEYANNDDFELFKKLFQLNDKELVNFITAVDFHTLLIDDKDAKAIRYNLLYTLRLKENQSPDLYDLDTVLKMREMKLNGNM